MQCCSIFPKTGPESRKHFFPKFLASEINILILRYTNSISQKFGLRDLTLTTWATTFILNPLKLETTTTSPCILWGCVVKSKEVEIRSLFEHNSGITYPPYSFRFRISIRDWLGLGLGLWIRVRVVRNVEEQDIPLFDHCVNAFISHGWRGSYWTWIVSMWTVQSTAASCLPISYNISMYTIKGITCSKKLIAELEEWKLPSMCNDAKMVWRADSHFNFLG